MKKFLALSLAAVMTAGSVFGLAACGEEKKPDDTNTPNQGQPNNPGTGKVTKDELLDKLAEFELGKFSFEGTVTGKTQFFNYDEEQESVVEEVSEIAFNASGAVNGDNMDLIATGKIDDFGMVGAAFLRGENFYVTSPDFWEYWEGLGIEEGDIDAYLSLFKDGERYFQRMEMEQMEETEYLVQSPLAPYVGRLMMNVCFFGEGKLETTDDGYTLTCNPLESAAALAQYTSNVLSVVSAEAKLSTLVSATPVVQMLDKLFAGISAEELYALYTENVAQGMPFELPAPEGDSVSAYLAKIVNSKELYGALVEMTGRNPFPAAKSFGDFTLKQIVGSDEEMNGIIAEIRNLLDGLKDKETILENLIHMIPGSEELLSFDADIDYVFDFDKNKELTQIAMNGDVSMSGNHAVRTPVGEVNKVEFIEFAIDFVITIEDVTLKDLTGMHYIMGYSPILQECEGSFYGSVYYYELIDGEPVGEYDFLDAEVAFKVEANNVIVVTVCVADIEYEKTFTIDLKEEGYDDWKFVLVQDSFDASLEIEGESMEIRVNAYIEIVYRYDTSDDHYRYCYISAENRVDLDFAERIGTI